ncbi:MAG: aldo/keto reductase [Myxococcales bacterium]|nr:aldo/keto reductase [Myxococcales bacterium]
MSTVLPPIPLSGDVSIPRLGFGVFRAGAATRSAVLTALQVGYRHIDTARVYKNEADVGEAIRRSGVPRGELFVTTKLFELHPFLQQRDVVAHCEALGIAVSAYSPLTKGKRLADPALGAIAREIGHTPAQVLIRWCLQRGWPTMPKSVTPERIAENFGALDIALSDDVMGRLTALEDGTRCAWDPSTVV